jgi:hypothetical protein
MTTSNTFDAPIPPIGSTPPVSPTSYLPLAPQPQPKRGTAAIIVGSVILGSGFLTAVSGGVLLGMFGDGQVLGSGSHTVTTSSSAMVADLGHIDDLQGLEFLTGSPTLHISAANVTDSGVFVGVGPTEDVEAYLQDVTIDRVSDLELAPFRLDTITDKGSSAASAPGEQAFWVASGQSSVESLSEAQLAWEIEDGRYEVVIMNADGSAGVSTLAAIGASLPTSAGLWTLVLGIGIALMIGGGALLYVGVRQDRRPGRGAVRANS